jgi:hypothetical protein
VQGSILRLCFYEGAQGSDFPYGMKQQFARLLLTLFRSTGPATYCGDTAYDIRSAICRYGLPRQRCDFTTGISESPILRSIAGPRNGSYNRIVLKEFP